MFCCKTQYKKYCIVLKNDFYIRSDLSMARILQISLDEYTEILKHFNAYSEYEEYFFKNKIDCEKCCEYLNETYEIIIELMK